MFWKLWSLRGFRRVIATSRVERGSGSKTEGRGIMSR
jgi:hypothetical protein